MKKLTLIKQLFFASTLIAGINIYSSCDGCNRQPDGSSEGTRDGMDANADTRGSEEPADNENSGSTEGTANDGKTSSTSIKASSGSKTTNTSTTATGTKNSEPTEEEITNQVENSNASHAYDKNGKPIISSGASGSGMGTGTGSTGNNSKVTTKEDQKS